MCAGIREEHTVKSSGQSSSYASDNNLPSQARGTSRPTAFSLFRLAFRRLWQWLMGTPSRMPAFPRELKVGLRLCGKSVGGGLLYLGSVVLPSILLQSECSPVLGKESRKTHRNVPWYISCGTVVPKGINLRTALWASSEGLYKYSIIYGQTEVNPSMTHMSCFGAFCNYTSPLLL